MSRPMSEKMMEHNPVRHVLLFRFRPGTTAESFQAFILAFRELSRKIEGIISFEHGANNSSEGLNHGMTHVVTLTFASVEARDAYLPHPEHRKFIEWFGPLDIIEELLVIDYIPQN
jgi:hypothetical protein